jgi:hypothetical protein|tara:strand:+ start:229 stop:483 length:255 start_codon:yes stop_codon:yes gene_type:complete
MNRITMAEASEINPDNILDIESLMIEKGSSTTNDDIRNFIKFICTKAEERGLVVRRKDRDNGSSEVGGDRRGDVKSDGMGSGDR